MGLLAQQLPPIAIAFGATVLIAVAGGVLFFYRWYESTAQKALVRAYEGLRVHQVPQDGDVFVCFQTYHGLLAWFTQTTHHVSLPADDAKILLRRLARFNLCWGSLTWGMLLIPLLSWINFRQQRWSIREQESSGGYTVPSKAMDVSLAESRVEQFRVESAEYSSSPTRLQRVLGWILTGLSVVFAISAVFNFTAGESDAALGLVVISALFGWFAKDWLNRSGR